MSLYVQKFGGTSVGSVERIQAVADRVAATVAQGHQLVVVVSAMSRETNRLLGLANVLADEPDRREMDVLLSTGEQVTIALLTMALQARGVSAKSYCGWQVPIKTNSSHTKARIEDIPVGAMQADLDQGRVLVVAGFQGVDERGDITTLGRGGSDTTGVALAAALSADECQIFTDVDGVYTTDPRVEPRARRLSTITFEEMLEMASLGSKVLQIRSVEFAGKYRVPLRVLSSFVEGEGTLITIDEGVDDMEKPVISGVAFARDEAKVTLVGVPDTPGIAARILGPVSKADIEVDMIVQNIGSDGCADFTFTLSKSDYAACLRILEDVRVELGASKVIGDDQIAKVSLVGVGMRSHSGVASRMFEALASESINIQLITTSEIKISVVIEEKYLELAVRVLHSAFELDCES